MSPFGAFVDFGDFGYFVDFGDFGYFVDFGAFVGAVGALVGAMAGALFGARVGSVPMGVSSFMLFLHSVAPSSDVVPTGHGGHVYPGIPLA